MKTKSAVLRFERMDGRNLFVTGLFSSRDEFVAVIERLVDGFEVLDFEAKKVFPPEPVGTAH